MKITGSVGGGNPKKVEEAIKRFKNERFPSVVVTVDLLTTGIDVPEITTLVFMRRVKSRILFEQMLGRATRLCPKIHKTHFEIMKFRTMKMETPKDMPTHLLQNPEQYITRVGGFLRKYSLDELPQILQIFTGKMSIVGPRPAL